MIAGLNDRTVQTWTRKKWLPLFDTGVGRGNQNLYLLSAATWAIALSELFQIWRRASESIWMFDLDSPKDDPRWERTELNDGKMILAYLEPALIRCGDDTSLVLDLVTGFKEVDGKMTGERFAEITLHPYSRTKLFLENWFQTAEDHTYVPPLLGQKFARIVQAATLIHLTQLHRRVKNLAATI